MSYLPRIAHDYQAVDLSESELVYYGRHLLLPGIGLEGQKKLKSARILVIGAGGLGCPVLDALSGAGVGHLTLIDADEVSLGNLARQWLYTPKDVGARKVEVAAEVIKSRNPYIRLETVCEMFAASNAESLVASHDLIVDATDDVETRYLIDEVCGALNRPWVHGALYRESGQVSVFWEQCKASYRKLYPEKSSAPTCAGAGVLGATASLIGSIQAQEVVKLVTGSAKPSVGIVQVLDTVRMELSQLRLPDVSRPEELETADSVASAHAYSWDVVEQRRSIGQRVSLVDLRPADVYAADHLPGAVLRSFDSILESADSLDLDGECVLYCEEGTLSTLLVEALRSRGRENVFHLEGGYAAWKSSY